MRGFFIFDNIEFEHALKYLIAGLGNIGSEYADTRHNVGFDVVDELAIQAGASFELDRHVLKTSIKYKGKQLLLIKPTTYMNLSGKAIRYWLNQEKIGVEHLLVIVDDVALPFGTIRIKGKGSDGGHNGLKDIQQLMGSTNYARLRFGIGDDFHRGQQVKHVLGKWTPDELNALPERILQATKAVQTFCSIGLARTMNEYNNKKG